MCDPLAACGDVHRAAVVLVDAFPWAAQSGSQRQEAFVTIEEIGFVSPIGCPGGSIYLRLLPLVALRNRTPGPPPFSSMNSTPASTSARLMTSRVALRGSCIPASN